MKVSNELLLERIDNIKSDIGEIKDHLAKLNNQTFKNTAFRIKQNTMNKMMIGFFSVFGLSIATILIKII